MIHIPPMKKLSKFFWQSTSGKLSANPLGSGVLSMSLPPFYSQGLMRTVLILNDDVILHPAGENYPSLDLAGHYDSLSSLLLWKNELGT
jgi:hypothetical protein